MRLVDLNYNFESDWLIELSGDKLSDNNLASELVENRSFLKPITIEEIVICMINHDVNPVDKPISVFYSPTEGTVHPFIYTALCVWSQF